MPRWVGFIYVALAVLNTVVAWKILSDPDFDRIWQATYREAS
jgi:hypothetical protein